MVHNYGHGGSGWSLSWGSAADAVRLAMEGSPRRVAVLGCGVIGLTSAILAQQAGAAVTIYAAEPMPATRSARATGTWSPDSRIALADAVPASFAAWWDRTARASFATHLDQIGRPSRAVDWSDRYALFDAPAGQPHAPPEHPVRPSPQGRPASLEFFAGRTLIDDLLPHAEAMPPGSTPFETAEVIRSRSLTFNIAEYGYALMKRFRDGGGVLRRARFRSPIELAELPEETLIDCPGYGARALWGDASIVPVRGQVAWLAPHPDLRYGVYWRGANVLGRRDGIAVQDLEGGDARGFDDADETPDPARSARALAVVAELYRTRFAQGARAPRQPETV